MKTATVMSSMRVEPDSVSNEVLAFASAMPNRAGIVENKKPIASAIQSIVV